MDKFDYIGNIDIQTVETIFEQYRQNPEAVEESWRNFFKGFEFASEHYPQPQAPKTQGNELVFDKEFKVLNLIRAYRQRGHLFTKTNPVRKRRQYFPTLDIANFGLSEKDLDTQFQAGKELGIGADSLKQIVAHLEQTYCHSVGVEFLYIRKPEMVQWLQSRMEKDQNTPAFSAEQKKHIFFHLKLAVGFEQFIHKKFVGQKRFSLEGAESLIPALHAVIERGADLGIREFILGMPHRGRLNVLANVLSKPYENIFQEFIGKQYDEDIELGDVKYHLGYGNDITTSNGKEVRLNLTPNPSHLETVGAVVQGIARAKIYHKYDDNYDSLAPIVIHGDAAVAAQGVVYETIQMSQLKGYHTGGTIHLVINNQVGFTTDYRDARSSTYCTDVAKVTRSPVFHVNGDDVEALIYTITLAMEFRQRFHTDVFIDILCYRRYGHNEGDEPRFTQPTLYKAIAKHPNPRDIYAQQLVEDKIYSTDDIKQVQKDFDEILEAKLKKSKSIEKVHIQQFLYEDWQGFAYPQHKDFERSPETGIEPDKLRAIAQKMNSLPKEKKFFRKIVKLYEHRQKMIENDQIDWALGELLAYGSLLEEGIAVRLSGQDSERGTFSHRHASLTMENTEEKYFPLKNLSQKQAPFHVFNSLLSEYGVMGFEYGFSLATPHALTIWEAQFGDFHNVAQPIIDQYISSGEEKWGLMSGLVLLLPHGYEGQGPEHSSARIERMLNLSAKENIQIVNSTTPANFFHALRRQFKRNFRVPLVVFTPKSLLRHPQCVSSLNDLAQGHFQEVIDDNNVEVENVKRVVFSSGKIYYDLLARKQELGVKDIALVRVEQLHPFPKTKIKAIVDKYKNALAHLWVQEEPENMGAWLYVQNEFIKSNILSENVYLIPLTRLPSGSPATGLYPLHVQGQKEIIGKVFRECVCGLNDVYCGLQCVEGSSREEIKKQHRYLFE